MRRISLLLGLVAIAAACSHSSGLPSTAGEAAGARAQATPTPPPCLSRNTPSYAVLYCFSPPPDGNSPTSTLVLAPWNHRLYGTTYGGGRTPGPSPGACARGCGTVYSIDPGERGKITIVHAFTGEPDGAIPQGDLEVPQYSPAPNAIFGTTAYGGHRDSVNCPQGCGTIYEITAAGKEEVLHEFTGGTSDGAKPVGAVRLLDGVLYGMTQYGGAKEFGTIFAWNLTTKHETWLYSFKGPSADGAYPADALVAAGDALYGVTSQGGTYNLGTIFRIANASTRSPSETVLHSFASAEGDSPVGMDHTGTSATLYGATSAGGPNERGTLFSIPLSGTKSGGYPLHVIYSFTGDPDGAVPEARPRIYDGQLYGTTFRGGNQGAGTVYKISIADPKQCVIHSFEKTKGGDGARPIAPVRQWLIGKDEIFYGTTLNGGTNTLGTIFRISPTAACQTPSPARRDYRVR